MKCDECNGTGDDGTTEQIGELVVISCWKCLGEGECYPQRKQPEPIPPIIFFGNSPFPLAKD